MATDAMISGSSQLHVWALSLLHPCTCLELPECRVDGCGDGSSRGIGSEVAKKYAPHCYSDTFERITDLPRQRKMESIEENALVGLVRRAEKNLNDAHRHFKSADNTLAREFIELKLQTCIYQYDVTIELAGVMRNRPEGFAAAVALKGLVLRLFEYDHAWNQYQFPRLKKLAEARNVVVDFDAIRKIKSTWKHELVELKSWHDVRNNAAGHYGADIVKQVEALESLTFDKVLTVFNGFSRFNMALMVILRDAGRGVGADCSGQPIPDTTLSFSSVTAGANP
jgi:hypothetical protein